MTRNIVHQSLFNNMLNGTKFANETNALKILNKWLVIVNVAIQKGLNVG